MTYNPWGYVSWGQAHASNAVFAIANGLVSIFMTLVIAVLAFAFIGVVHPILGIMAGLFIIACGGNMRRRLGLWTGDCPHCSQTVSVGEAIAAFDCPICKRRILVKDGEFRPLGAS